MIKYIDQWKTIESQRRQTVLPLQPTIFFFLTKLKCIVHPWAKNKPQPKPHTLYKIAQN